MGVYNSGTIAVYVFGSGHVTADARGAGGPSPTPPLSNNWNGLQWLGMTSLEPVYPRITAKASGSRCFYKRLAKSEVKPIPLLNESVLSFGKAFLHIFLRSKAQNN